MRTSLVAGMVLILAASAASARMPTARERARDVAEHACYDDVQRLCNADIPDEQKIAACMKVHRSQLSPACRKAFDAGMK